VPLVVVSSRADLGLAARRRGWFLIPEEVAPPKELEWLYREAPRLHRSGQRAIPMLASEAVVPGPPR
jgi:membrane glycosyltransferase